MNNHVLSFLYFYLNLFKLEGKIAGGHEKVNITEAPHQVSVLLRGKLVCGGSILKIDIVLTAAHCNHKGKDKKTDVLKIRAGSSSYKRGGRLYGIAESVTHPKNVGLLDYDVALLRLNKPLQLSDKVRVMKLVDNDRHLKVGAVFEATGWGRLKANGHFSSTLQTVKLPMVPYKKCKIIYGKIGVEVTPRMICAGLLQKGKGVCHGDSGGPLVYRGELVGVVSWSKACVSQGYPDVFARISTLKGWIEQNMRSLSKY